MDVFGKIVIIGMIVLVFYFWVWVVKKMYSISKWGVYLGLGGFVLFLMYIVMRGDM